MNAISALQKFELSDAEFTRLRGLVHAKIGIALTEGKRELVYGRLAKRLRTLELSSFADYCELVESGDTDELQQLANAITTNLTSFFRESHHFEQLAKEVLPQIEKQRRGSRRMRLWSAGCSTGEEPYSLAIVLRETLAHLRDWDIKLLATDIDSNVLATAAMGEYLTERFRGMSDQRLKRWFPSPGGETDHGVAADELRKLITFKTLNLLGSWPMKGPFDIIFCRNVVIYFDKDTQRALFERMAKLQEPGSWLFIGHSENLSNVTTLYKLIGRTVYQRT